jgi:hypothetical protein
VLFLCNLQMSTDDVQNNVLLLFVWIQSYLRLMTLQHVRSHVLL